MRMMKNGLLFLLIFVILLVGGYYIPRKMLDEAESRRIGKEKSIPENEIDINMYGKYKLEEESRFYKRIVLAGSVCLEGEEDTKKQWETDKRAPFDDELTKEQADQKIREEIKRMYEAGFISHLFSNDADYQLEEASFCVSSEDIKVAVWKMVYQNREMPKRMTVIFDPVQEMMLCLVYHDKMADVYSSDEDKMILNYNIRRENGIYLRYVIAEYFTTYYEENFKLEFTLFNQEEDVEMFTGISKDGTCLLYIWGIVDTDVVSWGIMMKAKEVD